MRIALIHALKHSIVPIETSFARLWPDAVLMNLLDDSLSADLARDGRLTEAMTQRFLSLGRYAASTGADAILFTCSAFGPCIEAVARAQAPMPVLKPNEAMISVFILFKGLMSGWNRFKGERGNDQWRIVHADGSQSFRRNLQAFRREVDIGAWDDNCQRWIHLA